ncbi:hypothetical protein DFS34DRAFT_589736 [Phlyctochytrium arcticum]|nr:hypothetical protein DFS34DRAFT_589736 [Phlyctochytrium arcticum]
MTAGFYTAQHLMRHLPNVSIDMYDALPVPYGLARFGVAPDHPEVKNVIHKFEALAQDTRFRFVGNVKVGKDIALDELKPRYDALVLSYGASQDRHLNVPNEHIIPNVFSARAFVGWYNGLPEHRNLNPDLQSSESAIIVGQGNVALDVARILLMPLSEIGKTDITEHALDALRKNKIRHVHLLAFTAKELREMLALPDIELKLDLQALQQHMAASATFLAKDRPRRRLLELLLKGATKAATSPPPSRSWTLHFLRSPIHLVTDGDPAKEDVSLKGVQFEVNKLEGPDDRPRAVGTGEITQIDGGMLLRSIGYKAVPLPGLSFDSRGGFVPNIRGKVIDQVRLSSSRIVYVLANLYESCKKASPLSTGLYVAGWLKRGPTGVIAATMYDAIETADAVIADVESGELPLVDTTDAPFNTIGPLLKARGVEYVDFAGWKKMDAVEVQEGALLGKPREKLVDIQRMLQIARG